MSPRHNGQPMLNGTGIEHGERVGVYNRHPVDDIEPAEIVGHMMPPVRQAALKIALNMETRSGAEIARELGITRQSLNEEVLKLCAAFQLGRRRRKKRAASVSPQPVREEVCNTGAVSGQGGESDE